MPPPIQVLAEKLIEERGVEYQFTARALKLHIEDLSETDFLDEMVRVDNIDIFPVLWSMGLNRKQQEIAMARWKELT